MCALRVHIKRTLLTIILRASVNIIFINFTCIAYISTKIGVVKNMVSIITLKNISTKLKSKPSQKKKKLKKVKVGQYKKGAAGKGKLVFEKVCSFCPVSCDTRPTTIMICVQK